MFIRKKNVNGIEYAYLVENKYNKRKKQSRQKATKYLGKIIKLPENKAQTEAITTKESIINELIGQGFSLNKNLLKKDSITIDLNKLSVDENNKSVCIELNEGFLCAHTLTNLLSFSSKNLTQKEIIMKFADAFVSAGINLHHESFIKIFNKELKP
jgi:hypothetical protein